MSTEKGELTKSLFTKIFSTSHSGFPLFIRVKSRENGLKLAENQFKQREYTLLRKGWSTLKQHRFDS